MRASSATARGSAERVPFTAVGRALGDAGALKRAGTAPEVPRRKIKDKKKDTSGRDTGRDTGRKSSGNSLHTVAF